jgi:hypothetical protein
MLSQGTIIKSKSFSTGCRLPLCGIVASTSHFEETIYGQTAIKVLSQMSAADKSIGPDMALKVKAGDKLELETFARYGEKTNYPPDGASVPLVPLLATLSNILFRISRRIEQRNNFNSSFFLYQLKKHEVWIFS